MSVWKDDPEPYQQQSEKLSQALDDHAVNATL
jgi:hypothetical protein